MSTDHLPQVPQNPVPRGESVPGARAWDYCPYHGPYQVLRAYVGYRMRAVSGQETPEQSRAMLDTAARLRRTCRECRRTTCTIPVWALQVREEIRVGQERRVRHDG